MHISPVKWIIPGILTILLGTAAITLLSSENIEQDLTLRANSVLKVAGLPWADVTFSGRDATLRGITTDPKAREAVATAIAQLHGVRSVQSSLSLAPKVTPYPFVARIEAGQISLDGGIPDEEIHERILAEVDVTNDNLRPLSGYPDRIQWIAATEFALRQLQNIEHGEVRLNDLELSISGRAKSQEAYETISIILEAGLPAGVKRGDIDITPPLQKPFTWRAVLSDGTLDIKGYAPSRAAIREIASRAPRKAVLSPDMNLASGAPKNFTSVASSLLSAMSFVRQGEASIVDDKVVFSGIPRNPALQGVLLAVLKNTGAIIDLAPPHIKNYRFSAIKKAGSLSLSGYVPNEGLFESLATRSGIELGGLKLGSGAPELFEDDIMFGLTALEGLAEGSFKLDGNGASLSGSARSRGDYEKVQDLVAAAESVGLRLRHAQVSPFLATPYAWSASKNEGGTIVLSGYIPNADARQRLMQAAGTDVLDVTSFGVGEPAGFEESAIAGLQILSRLAEGDLILTRDGWSINGRAKADEFRTSAADTPGTEAVDKDWQISIQTPLPELATADPYTWTSERNSSGEYSFSGYVPVQSLQRFLKVRAKIVVSDTTELASGAPDGFVDATLAGLAVLDGLMEGRVTYTGVDWLVTGKAASENERDNILSALAGVVDMSDWRVEIDAPPTPITPYLWTVAKTEDGKLTFTGHVPTPQLQRFLSVRAGDNATNNAVVGFGAPEGFVDDSLVALAIVKTLKSGAAGFDGDQWFVEGESNLVDSDESIKVALVSAKTDGIEWQVNVIPMPRIIKIEEMAEEPVLKIAVAKPEAKIKAVEPPVEVPAYRFTAKKQLGAAIRLLGAVPADQTRRYLGVIAGGIPTYEMRVTTGKPGDFVSAAVAGVRALSNLRQGELAHKDGVWSLTGVAHDQATRENVLASINAADTSLPWRADIILVPTITLCRESIVTVTAANTILFGAGSARLAKGSSSSIDNLAVYLRGCPDASVHVEGHTDADGSETKNLALSVARAETVVDELIARGVEQSRLYAVGYGEGLPIAPNNTTAGKRQNRRIVFTILDDAQ